MRAELFVVVQIVRQHHHDGRSGDSHKEGELRDIKSPAYVAAQPGDSQAQVQLPQIKKDAGRDHAKQTEQPCPVAAASYHRFFEHEHGVRPGNRRMGRFRVRARVDGKTRAQQLPGLRIRIRQIAEDE